jgi:hypothetical protein
LRARRRAPGARGELGAGTAAEAVVVHPARGYVAALYRCGVTTSSCLTPGGV